MKQFLLVFTFLLMTHFPVFGTSLKFDSAHSIALVGTISDGKILSTSTFNSVLKQEITQQLRYTIGQFNGLEGGSPDMNRLKISIGESKMVENGLFEVSYAAELFIAWPEEMKIPDTYELILPSRGDHSSLLKFVQAFGADEDQGKTCLDWSAHDITPGIFWYYYRPNKSRCPLSKRPDHELVRYLNINLKVSDKNTKDKSPEYGKIWEDGKLVATLIFGMADKSAISESDAGVSSYRSTVNTLIEKFGPPTSSSVPNLTYLSEGLKHPHINLVFQTDAGTMDVSIFLIKEIKSATSKFRNEYNKRTLISDYISYSGHSGLGANIRALARMGKFATDQYQIFLVNGCDTFAYVDDALANAHKRVNPDFGKDKFIDIITNAMPSYFHMNTHSNMVILDALVGQKKTYRKILKKFDKTQRAVVTGEQDNNWPKDFYGNDQ